MAAWRASESFTVDSAHEIEVHEQQLVEEGVKGALSRRSGDWAVRASVFHCAETPRRLLFTVTTTRSTESRIVAVRDVQMEALRRAHVQDWSPESAYTI